jgi:hypothetical protein
MSDDETTGGSASVAEHPIPLAAFASTIRGSDREVYARLLRVRHGAEKHTVAEWHALIDSLATEPA